MLDFIFSEEDYYKIPGLSRPWDNIERPNLAPVFFDNRCLGDYLTYPEYACSINESYGFISHKDFNISFGINKSKKVIMWLGDLEKLPEKEKERLRTYNINSDHDIDSQFYNSQINGEFVDSIKEVEILLQKAKINKIFHKKFGFNLFKDVFEDNDIDEVFKQVKKYSSIILGRVEDFQAYIKNWNNILIDGIQKKELIEYLKCKKIETKKEGNDLGEIKLFEKLIHEKITNDNIIFPYFVLRDLRNWSSHEGLESEFNSSMERLSLKKDEDDYDYELIYKTLIKKIIAFHNKILLWGISNKINKF